MKKLIPKLKQALLEEDPTIDSEFIEKSILIPQSQVSEKILNYYCKERAIEDLILGLHEKEMSVE